MERVDATAGRVTRRMHGPRAQNGSHQLQGAGVVTDIAPSAHTLISIPGLVATSTRLHIHYKVANIIHKFLDLEITLIVELCHVMLSPNSNVVVHFPFRALRLPNITTVPAFRNLSFVASELPCRNVSTFTHHC